MPVWPWIALVALAALFAGWRIGRAWWRYRGDRVIMCPENHRPAGVSVDAAHAAATALGRSPELRLSTCSRWPEKSGCGQECLSQIHAAPEDCLVRNVATRWFAGKSCANCGRPFGEIHWAVNGPALLTTDKKILEWKQVPADRIYDTLAASLPVCFGCHTALRMVSEHPDLVIDRHRTT